MNRFAFLGLALLLAACGQEVVLPPAAPLSASAEQLALIPNLAPGALKVLKGEPVELTVSERSLRLRVVQPDGLGPFPVLLFSHGNWSDITKYDALLEHWASHGYVTLSPYHLDGGGMLRGIVNSLRYGNEGLIGSRTVEITWLLDNLDALDSVSPGLPAKLDKTRIAATGHSFGAFTAQMLGGGAAVDPETGARVEGFDERIKAVLAISPPGPMFKIINEQSWTQMRRPMLVTTGTWDVNKAFWPEWTAHKLSFDTAPAGNNWLLVVQGADHYLGNLICRPERKGPPQTDALRMFNALSVTFLNAQLRGDETAQAFLATRPLAALTGGFADLSQR